MPAVLCDSMPSTAFVSGASSLVGAEQRFWSAIPDDRSDISEEEELDQDFEQVIAPTCSQVLQRTSELCKGASDGAGEATVRDVRLLLRDLVTCVKSQTGLQQRKTPSCSSRQHGDVKAAELSTALAQLLAWFFERCGSQEDGSAVGAATVRRLQQRVERILRLLQTSAGIEPVQGQQHEQDVDGVPAFGFSNGRSRSSTPSFSMWSAPAPLQHLSSPPSSRSAGGTESEGSTWTTEVKGAAALTLALPPLPSPSLVAAAASMASATGPHGSPRSGHLPLWMRGSKGASVMLTECDTDAAIAAVPAEHQEQFLQRVQEQRQQLRACLAQQQDSYYQHSTSDTAQHAASKGAARPLPLPLLEGEDEAGVEEVEVGEMPLFPTQAHDLATGEPLANIIPAWPATGPGAFFFRVRGEAEGGRPPVARSPMAAGAGRRAPPPPPGFLTFWRRPVREQEP
ncbi:hypothetical protein CHLRE_11g475500v5 [Chlamydomonas reinhardtii]|uniref:Uncharacterized protein n=1 Tax=Chlamydomonas reinhardtii TaxID=3055 RepID=A0A2K3D8A9_CHLRE|nr:uncharacterized protein CHLRE_11g475500v5 [Chlamydomonas reinhardtii]PNW76770.1 hypothetical protein CHLRE_11g475500v5 [Chlamydomonas reinhardtii]